jgi:hypothetical protein
VNATGSQICAAATAKIVLFAIFDHFRNETAKRVRLYIYRTGNLNMEPNGATDDLIAAKTAKLVGQQASLHLYRRVISRRRSSLVFSILLWPFCG